jgi:xanthine/uracil permease
MKLFWSGACVGWLIAMLRNLNISDGLEALFFGLIFGIVVVMLISVLENIKRLYRP